MPQAIRRALVVAVAAALAVTFAAPAFAGAESSMVKKVNSARSANGKDPVAVYWDLTDDARAHARRMADEGQVSPITSVTSDWDLLAQIVGVGTSVGQLFDAFMASPPHRSTILGNFNYIGVGIETDDNGHLWVAIIFMKGPDDLLDPPDTTTTTTISTTTSTTTEPPATTTTTTTTTEPPSSATTTTTSTVPPDPTTTTTSAPLDSAGDADPTPPFVPQEDEFSTLSDSWIPPELLRPLELR